MSVKQVFDDTNPSYKRSCPDICRYECWDMMTSPKWWANWFGFLLAAECAVAAYLYSGDPDRDEDDLYEFHPWSGDPSEALNATNALGMFGLTFVGIFACIVVFEANLSARSVRGSAANARMACPLRWVSVTQTCRNCREPSLS